VRQKFGKPSDGVIGDAGEDVLEPGEGFDSDALTGGYEAAQHGGCLAAEIAAKEYPVVTTDRYAANRALGGVIVYRQISSSQ
jgi:hypothetical protein